MASSVIQRILSQIASKSENETRLLLLLETFFDGQLTITIPCNECSGPQSAEKARHSLDCSQQMSSVHHASSVRRLFECSTFTSLTFWAASTCLCHETPSLTSHMLSTDPLSI